MIWKMADVAGPRNIRRFAARVMVAIVLAGAALRLAYINRPFDHRTLSSWRESDYTQLARNYWREDPNILHPRIDWRRDGPGLVEMEFPLVPWAAGMLYHLLGYHEEILRTVSAVLEIGGLLLFAGLARRLLPAPSALAALAFYVVNPLLVYLSTAMQPEPLMLFFSLLAVVLIERWDRTGSTPVLFLAAAALGGAILAKARPPASACCSRSSCCAGPALQRSRTSVCGPPLSSHSRRRRPGTVGQALLDPIR